MPDASPGNRKVTPSAAPSPARESEVFRLLPLNQTFAQLLWPFVLPYAGYVAVGSLPAPWFSPEIVGVLRFLLVAGLLIHFRKQYRFGLPLTARNALSGLAWGLVATALWIVAYRLALYLPVWRDRLSDPALLQAPSAWAWGLRALNSTLLVPFCEELFCRAFVGEFLEHLPNGSGGFIARLGRRWDQFPAALSAPALSRLSVIGCTLVFTLGHGAPSWIAAALYFLFTSWVYARTRSFRVCMLIHAVANLSIAILVKYVPDLRFLWS